MKYLKRLCEKARVQLGRVWERLNRVDYESYLRERAYQEAKERSRLKYYGRGGW